VLYRLVSVAGMSYESLMVNMVCLMQELDQTRDEQTPAAVNKLL
jgi:hypothetical protein